MKARADDGTSLGPADMNRDGYNAIAPSGDAARHWFYGRKHEDVDPLLTSLVLEEDRS